MKKKFEITNGCGFHITFENGYTVSTQFGYGSYSENYSNYKMTNNAKSDDCEVAIWNNSDVWITRYIFRKIGIELNDDVAPKVDIETWYKVLETVKNEV